MCKQLVTVLLLVNCVLVELRSDLGRVKRQELTPNVNNNLIELFNECKCVFYYQCNANNTINTNGEGIIDTRAGENEEQQNKTVLTCQGGTFDGEIVCCKLNGTTITETRSPPDGTGPTVPPKTVFQCGAQRTKINVRIWTDDDNSIDGEFPWIVAIYKRNKNKDGWKFHCSGALIHPKVILTANHYFHRKNAADFKVVLNGNVELPELGIDTKNERNVAEIVHHPRYYGGALYNDGALLFLDKPFESTRRNSINSLCLPPDQVIDSGRCLVAGWGNGSVEDGIRILKKVEVPLVSFEKCQDLLRKTRLGEEFDLHSSFMCAGGEKDKDACKGDGGTPLMCLLPGSTRYYHAGIVSWGIECGQENVPGVYASTTVLKPWILEELKKKSLEV